MVLGMGIGSPVGIGSGLAIGESTTREMCEHWSPKLDAETS